MRDVRNDATTEERVWAETRLIDAARRSDKADIVREAEARLQQLKHLLAEEKKGRFEPLKPDPYPGRATLIMTASFCSSSSPARSAARASPRTSLSMP